MYIPIANQLVVQNIKLNKSEAKKFIKRQRIIYGLIILVLSIIFLFIGLTIIPELEELYKEFGANVPILIQKPSIFIGIFVLLIIFAFRLLATDPDYSALNSKFSLTELKTMPLKDLHNTKVEWIMIGIIGFIVGVLVISIIVPIYNLTSNF
jgi:type II secretory pathway component PulF